MPRKEQGWITFQASDDELQILEQYCQTSQRTKTEILRELVRSLNPVSNVSVPDNSATQKQSARSSKRSVKPATDRTSEPRVMRVSARNVLRGVIKQLVIETVSAEVVLEIAPGVELVSVITATSATELDLYEGKEVYAVIKSSNVMIAES